MAEVVQNQDLISILFEILPPTVYIVIIALYMVGMVLKKIPKFPDWLIPVALMIAGGVITPSLIGYTTENLLYGIIAGGLAVGGHSAFKQIAYKRPPK